MNYLLKRSLILLIVFNTSATLNAKDFLITGYGAKGDNKTNCTIAIQKTVNECASAGGGTVIVPAGVFLSAKITLKSNVNFHLSSGATLKAIADGVNYESLLLVDRAENVSVTGEGTLSGSGELFTIKEAAPSRPYVLFIKDSRNILVENITLRQSAAWTLRLYGNEHVIIKGISIYSHANFNNDGIDIDSKDVVVTGCIIDSGDDAICLKSEDPNRPTENITITNCIAASNCNLIKMGTSSFGGFKNISISNCVLRHASESPLHNWNISPDHYIDEPITGISGIALEIVDGGVLDQVSISNITMTGVQTPIFMRLGSRKNPTGTIKNVIISNVIATSHSRMSSTIAGVPGFKIENVVLRDIILNGPGGGTLADAARKLPEHEKDYPENRIFGWSLPSYGLYIRHAKNITLDNIQFNLAKPDSRPALWLEDVYQLKANGLKTGDTYIGENMIKMVNSDKCSFN